MAKFVVAGDTTLEILKLIFPNEFPIKAERELVQCKDCKHCLVIPMFPDHPYCEARMFGKTVSPDFFCADGEKE